MLRRHKLVTCSVLALIAALATSACGKFAGGKEAESVPVAEVTVTRVTRADLSQSLTVTGTVAALPNEDVRVSSLVPGRVAAMLVTEGDRVARDQLLVRLDDRVLLDQLHQTEAALEQAKASLENARLARERNESLLQRGIAARKEVEDARTQVTLGEASVRQAEAALALARLQLARAQVRSPLTGVVVKRFASVGEQVDGTAGQPLLEVARLEQVELLANVPALYLSKIKVGEQLEVKAGSGEGLHGRIVAVSPAVESASDVGLVRIRLANPGGVLRLGMFLTAQLPLETHLQALSVPPQAVYRNENGQHQVYRVVGETAEAVPVTLGLETADRVELLSGVGEGDTVILHGGYGLSDHARVQVKP
ncbi:MAG: efflux RND transporter periplasmic adaptor subunit [Terriglobales bacterium]